MRGANATLTPRQDPEEVSLPKLAQVMPTSFTEASQPRIGPQDTSDCGDVVDSSS